MSPMRPEQRLAYRASIDRPRVSLPGGKAVAVWPVVNVEHWLIDNPMPRQVLVAPTGAPLQPDLANWGWHEYGMRVGFWRMLEAFARRGIRPTLSINGSVCLAYPRLARAAHEAGWEFMAHGFVQVPTHRVQDQRAMIARTVETIASFTGKACRGWLGPGLTETLETPDLLAQAGIGYIGDWVVDDLPCRLKTQAGEVLTMPYSVELNDIPVIMIQHHAARELADRVLATADRLLAEARDPGILGGAKVMSFAIHPYITGVPHRIGMLEAMLDGLLAREGLVFMQGGEIADWYLGTGSDV
ncbi:MAG: polysaccharide deacetylase family protein [Hyphomicrobiaceae bacterium]|nr:polysaccharide deacetylase family protein [Hyphomicrobiaceae bacterium]